MKVQQDACSFCGEALDASSRVVHVGCPDRYRTSVAEDKGNVTLSQRKKIYIEGRIECQYGCHASGTTSAGLRECVRVTKTESF